MTYIRLVRHGETDWNIANRTQGWTDIPLNDRRKEQANNRIADIQDIKWDLCITSPLLRAKETAQIFQEICKFSVIEDASWKERNYGDVEGMIRSERKARYPDQNYPNSESRKELTYRVMNRLYEIQQQYTGKKILIVTHGGAINAVLTACSEGNYGFDRTKITNLSFTDIVWQDGSWHIVQMNK